MRIHERMTPDEIEVLLKEWWEPAHYEFPTHFEHRFEQTSSAMMYALIREYRPKNVVALGTSHGGSTCIIMSALLANEQPFKYLASEIEDDLREETRVHCIEKTGQAPELIGDLTKHENYPDQIDFLFHDTNHDRETTEWVFKNIIPKVKPGGLLIFHDWAVCENENGEWIGKGDNGAGGWPETEYMLELHRAGVFPFKKVFFNSEHSGRALETGVFLKK